MGSEMCIRDRPWGRPPIDPVMLVKYLLVGYLYGIPSERQIEQRIQTDVALRWYLGLDLFDRVPDHSTISQLRRRKPSFRKVFRRLIEEVVRQCIEKGLVSGRPVLPESPDPRHGPRLNSRGMTFLMMRRTMFTGTTSCISTSTSTLSSSASGSTLTLSPHKTKPRLKRGEEKHFPLKWWR